MIPGPRSPRKHQIYLHLEGKQKTPSQHHRHPLHGRRRRSLERPSNRKDADAGLPLAPPPRTPRHSHSSAASRPHCRDPTEFPVSDNDAISVREETHNKPGPTWPRCTPCPRGQRTQRPGEPPQDRPAGAAAPRPVPRSGTTSGADPVAGRGDRGPGGEGGRRHSPRARRAPTAALPNRERGRRAGATAGDGGSGAEAPNSGPWRVYHGDPPHSSAGPGDSLKEP